MDGLTESKDFLFFFRPSFPLKFGIGVYSSGDWSARNFLIEEQDHAVVRDPRRVGFGALPSLTQRHHVGFETGMIWGTN